MKTWLISLSTVLILLFSYSTGTAQLKFHGVKIKVTNMDVAIDFYVNKLGFDIESKADFPATVTLKTNSFPIYLELVDFGRQATYPKEARTGLTIQTNKLLPRIDQLRNKGIQFYEALLTKNGVGISIPFKDPFDNVLHLMEVQARSIPVFQEPRVYNAGVTIRDMSMATDLYIDKLGFQIYSNSYLPEALPLKHPDNSFAFMIHYKEGLARNTINDPNRSQIVIVLETTDLSKTKPELTKKGILQIQSRRDDMITIIDSEGNMLEVIEN